MKNISNRVKERVRYFKIQKKGMDIMCEIADRIRNEGREEGKSIGRLESRIEDILELLEELGQVPQWIVVFIKAEDSLDVLSRWLKTAARAASITEFEANMQETGGQSGRLFHANNFLRRISRLEMLRISRSRCSSEDV